MTRAVLTGRDARILAYLLQVCRIGRHHQTWDCADVRRVAAEHLRPSLLATPTTPTAAGPRRHVTKPRDHYPMPADPLDVDLTARQARALDHLRAGHRPEQAAEDLRCSPGRAANLYTELVHAAGAVDRHHLLRLVDAGKITVHILQRGNRT